MLFDGIVKQKEVKIVADLDETIKGLECCAERFPRNKKCGECPYVSICYHDRACDELLDDALELLKEQPKIVRCKECKRRTESGFCREHWHPVSDEQFCEKGTSKDGD